MLTSNTIKSGKTTNYKQFAAMLLAAPLLLLALGMEARAQAEQPKTINVSMSATEMLPADLVIFNIHINAEADTPQEAFKQHKTREAALARMLKQFKIKEENITYEPISISKRYRDSSKTSVTRQSVTVTFDDFSLYEKIQIGLIDSGFDSFNGQFSSSKLQESKDGVLVKAIEAAREKAEIIAKSAGVKLGGVRNVNYGDHQISARSVNAFEMKAMASDASMMDFPQTVSVTVSINITFDIE